MTPIDYASRIIPVVVEGHNFIVSLGSDSNRFVLGLGKAEAIDLIALRARKIIAAEIALALRDEGSRLAAMIDVETFAYRMAYSTQASQLCREQSETHLYYI